MTTLTAPCPAPMEAADWNRRDPDAHGDLFALGPVIVQPKYNGWRCRIFNGVAYAKSGRPVPNPGVQSAARVLMAAGLDRLDGELVAGMPGAGDVYEKTTGICQSADATTAWELKLYAFDDLTDLSLPFADRLAALEQRPRHDFVKLSPSWLCNDEAALIAREKECFNRGHEGVVIRDPAAPYLAARASITDGPLWKLKRFDDAEAEILTAVEMPPRAGKPSPQKLGALRCTYDGEAFSIGAGFSAKDRRELWDMRGELPGRLVKFRFQGLTAAGKPRHASYLGLRDPADMAATNLDQQGADMIIEIDDGAVLIDHYSLVRASCGGWSVIATTTGGDIALKGPLPDKRTARQWAEARRVHKPGYVERIYSAFFNYD